MYFYVSKQVDIPKQANANYHSAVFIFQRQNYSHAVFKFYFFCQIA